MGMFPQPGEVSLSPGFNNDPGGFNGAAAVLEKSALQKLGEFVEMISAKETAANTKAPKSTTPGSPSVGARGSISSSSNLPLDRAQAVAPADILRMLAQILGGQ